MHRIAAATLAVACFCLPLVVLGEDQGLSLDDVLALARERAPAIVSARQQIDEARGRLAGASIPLRYNPVVQTAAGPRLRRSGSTRADIDAGISQTFELGGRRAARIAGATAEVESETARSDDATRGLLRDAAMAFLRALAAEQWLRLATAAEDIAGELQRTVERRYQSGDVSVLELNLASTATARLRSDRRAEEAGVAATAGELRVLVGLSADEPVRLRGALRDRQEYDFEDLVAQSAKRADLRQLAARIREAEADVRVGKGAAWPNIGIGVQYSREERANIALGTFTATLPVFARGQEQIVTGMARASRLRFELAAKQRAAEVEVRTAFEVYRIHLEAAEDLEHDVLQGLDDNEALGRRSYEAGELSLSELLLIRRAALDTRRAYQNRLLDAALAGVELEYRAGVLR